MALGPNDDVVITAFHQLDERLDVARVKLHVGVEESYEVTRRLTYAVGERVTLAHVDGISDDLQAGRSDLARLGFGVISVAVRHQDDFIVHSQLVELAQKPQ